MRAFAPRHIQLSLRFRLSRPEDLKTHRCRPFGPDGGLPPKRHFIVKEGTSTGSPRSDFPKSFYQSRHGRGCVLVAGVGVAPTGFSL